jgi:hypothetical protein
MNQTQRLNPYNAIKQSMFSKVKLGKRQKLSLLSSAFSVVFIMGLLTAQVFSQGTSNLFTISSGVYPSGPSYTVFLESGVAYAKDSYGALASWSGSTNISYVISQSLIYGASVTVQNGNYILNNSVTLTNLIGKKLSLEVDAIYTAQMLAIHFS